MIIPEVWPQRQLGLGCPLVFTCGTAGREGNLSGLHHIPQQDRKETLAPTLLVIIDIPVCVFGPFF